MDRSKKGLYTEDLYDTVQINLLRLSWAFLIA